MRDKQTPSVPTTGAIADARMVLATDLDGTFLGGTDAERTRLYNWLRSRSDVALVFVTGRDPWAIRDICASGFVPAPSFVIGDVGTTIATFENGTVQPIPRMEAEIARLWGDRVEELRAAVSQVPGLWEQDTPFRFRLSYHYDAAAFDAARMEPIRRMGFDVLVSHGRFVDILPPGVSKGPSLLRLIGYLGLEPDRVLVAGDTLNDLSMFETGLPGAVVGGAEAELLEAVAGLPSAHVCKAVGAAGIIEAIHAHNLHPEPPEVFS